MVGEKVIDEIEREMEESEAIARKARSEIIKSGRRSVVLITMPLIFALLSAYVAALPSPTARLWGTEFPRSFFASLSGLGVGVALLFATMRYLQFGFGRRDIEGEVADKVAEDMRLRRLYIAGDNEILFSRRHVSLTETDESMQSPKKVEPKKSEKNPLVIAVEPGPLAGGSQKLTEEGESVRRAKQLDSEMEQTRRRLNQEIKSLGFRGNLNLALGGLTTVSGLIILAVFITNVSAIEENIILFIIKFVPRLTLVIFIEIFAYFFLRLYKASLSEIKYFQNELTNVEQRNIALISALESEDKEIIKDVVAKIARTERNHVLEKGQTTIELEKVKIDRKGVSDVMKNLREVFHRDK